MSDYYKALREMLRSVRLACGFSQRAVAEALGITRSAYTYYETGKTAPDIPALLTLASVFSLPAEAFLHPEDFAGLESARRRVPKRIEPDLSHIGNLREEEKALVACFRAAQAGNCPK